MGYILFEFAARNTAGLLLVALLVLAGTLLRKPTLEPVHILKRTLAILSGFWIAVLALLFINHIRFPLFLDLMEGTVFQHFQRAANFQHIYTEPSPEFVPLAYNVFFYLVSVPFSWVFGESLFTLRLVSILATIGTGSLIYWVLRRETGSKWWGLIGAGLFAASYHVMDCYLDTAHSDACFVLCSLAGTAVIHYNRSRNMRLLGLAILIASFWFKQHGALFAIGGVLFLTWDEGWRKSWPYWLLTLVLGPVTYIFLGPLIFGTHFHYFTYHVPSGWSNFSIRSLVRLAIFLIEGCGWLVLAAIWWFASQLSRAEPKPSVWHFQLLVALGTALMGSLDEFSSNNVYIPLVSWLVLCGVWGLSRLDAVLEGRWNGLVPTTILVLSFALAAFNPLHVMRSWRADQDYREFAQFLEDLQGEVYAPSLGQLPDDFSFYPGAHWVALEDMVRGPNKDTRNHPLIQEILTPLLTSGEPVYILENYPLTTFPWFEYLNDHFVLKEDLGDRFRALEVLPGRYSHGWPRYLYQRDPESVGNEK